MTDGAFAIDEVTVRYGQRTAVDRVSFASPPARITALLGHNGAGKSSLLSVLTTVRAAEAGTVRIFGHNVRREATAARRWLGVVFQEPTLDPELSVERNLWFHARLFGMSRADAQVRIAASLMSFGLADRARTEVGELSGGLARRVEIVRALLHGPGLLVLDEPTAGLDPGTRRQVWDDLRRLRRDAGVAVLYSTHYMEEAEFADQIVILNEGRVVRRGTPAELKAGLAAASIELSTHDDDLACGRLAAAGYDATRQAAGVVVRCDDPERHVAVVVGAAGVDVRTVAVRRPTMDDVYLEAGAASTRARNGSHA